MRRMSVRYEVQALSEGTCDSEVIKSLWWEGQHTQLLKSEVQRDALKEGATLLACQSV